MRSEVLEHARQSLAAAFGGDGKLYVFGGCACRGSIPLYSPGNAAEKTVATAEAEAQKQAVAETEVYDPKTDTWSTAPPMRTPRMLFAAASGADGKIYVIGGQTFWGGEPLANVDVYDPATKRWSRGPSLRIGRVGHTAVTTGDGTIWVVGGSASTPSVAEVARVMAGDKGGPTTSVELLATAPAVQ
ncbi:MAG: kelch repeat-containing protein [Myxococcota bacterium]